MQRFIIQQYILAWSGDEEDQWIDIAVTHNEGHAQDIVSALNECYATIEFRYQEV